jgi:hypothetical protein
VNASDMIGYHGGHYASNRKLNYNHCILPLPHFFNLFFLCKDGD